jgi:phosphoribosylformimino-5-aminoimidazole carboxamide ribonucleotide (ProFAR) isomerase
MGVPRFVYTDVAKDGMLAGPERRDADPRRRRHLAHVTASGGVAASTTCGRSRPATTAVDAAIVGKALYSGAFTLEEALAPSGTAA